MEHWTHALGSPSSQIQELLAWSFLNKHKVTMQMSCTTQIILYPSQVPGNSYHMYMVIYKYSIYIFDMNMISGSHALLHVEKSEKNGVLRVSQILHIRV
jgi:hypothetical protein